ncbi:DUF892 family protein [Caballeronia sp. LZ043]|uniref:DUF892 family protein n=1 Tax=Caballeronia sp. LZ043 TaxID=3038569 RepID=UPI002857C812|nr:DUF892 family protein [Caballeronia sp. LZ043]MDR5822389.1 DUF892 family protein [Caballeronia sp. LZ043]
MKYVFETYNRVSCTSLIAAAVRCGHALTKTVCELILPQEQAMARWLIEQVQAISVGYLLRATSGVKAKK